MSSFLRRSLLPFLAFMTLIAAASAAGYALLSAPPAEAIIAEPLPVTTLTIRAESGYRLSREFVGRVTARRSSQMGFESGGQLLAVAVEEGASVVADQLLARLDDSRLLSRRKELRAQSEEIQARLELASLNRKRNQDLQGRGMASAQALDETRAEEQALTAQLQSVAASLATLAVDIAKTELRAPFAAIVINRYLDEGQVVNAGEPVLRLLEQGAAEARVGIPQDQAARLLVGNTLQLTVEGRPHQAQVAAILPELNSATRTQTVILTLDGAMPPEGALVRLDLGQQVTEPGFWLPLTALSEGLRGLWTAYGVVEENGERRVVRHELEVLHQETERVFVRGTLQDGNQLIASGVHRVVPGQWVRIVADPSEMAE